MTKIEGAKVIALSKCRMGFYAGQRKKFIRQLIWMWDNSRKTHLSWNQRFFLDTLIWTFRAQLAAMDQDSLGFQLPTKKPRREDYEPRSNSTQAALPL